MAAMAARLVVTAALLMAATVALPTEVTVARRTALALLAVWVLLVVITVVITAQADMVAVQLAMVATRVAMVATRVAMAVHPAVTVAAATKCTLSQDTPPPFWYARFHFV